MTRAELEAMAEKYAKEKVPNKANHWGHDAFIAGFLAGRDAAAVIPVNITPISKGSDAGVVLKKVYQKIKALGEE